MLALFWASYCSKDIIKTWSSCIRYSLFSICFIHVWQLFIKGHGSSSLSGKGTHTDKQTGQGSLWYFSVANSVCFYEAFFFLKKKKSSEMSALICFFSGSNHYSAPSSRTLGRHLSLVSLLASFVTLFPSKSHPPYFKMCLISVRKSRSVTFLLLISLLFHFLCYFGCFHAVTCRQSYPGDLLRL